MISCKEAMANLSLYLDGEVSERFRRSLEDHLRRCRRCWVTFDGTRKTLRIVTDAATFVVPLEVSARLYARLADYFDRAERGSGSGSDFHPCG